MMENILVFYVLPLFVVAALQVKMRLRAFYDDACFTVAAQDAFLAGFAAEVAHALNIKMELIIDLNAFHTDKHNEMEVKRHFAREYGQGPGSRYYVCVCV